MIIQIGKSYLYSGKGDPINVKIIYKLNHKFKNSNNLLYLGVFESERGEDVMTFSEDDFRELH